MWAYYINPYEEQQDRLDICRTDQCKKYDPQGKAEETYLKGLESCGECGCTLKFKTSFKESKCPLGFW